MTVKLLSEQHFEFLSYEGAAQTRLCLHMSKCHIIGNHVSWLNLEDIIPTMFYFQHLSDKALTPTSLRRVLSLIIKDGDKLHIEQFTHFYEKALHMVSYFTSLRKVLSLIIKDGDKLHIEQFTHFYEKALHMVS